MNRLSFFILLGTFAFACGLYAQAPSGSGGVVAEVKQSYNTVKNNIQKSAEKMTEADYAAKPTPEVRSFAEVLDHIADSQTRACSAVVGDQKTPSAAGKTSKADVMAALNDSFAECDKAFDSVTDANASEMVKIGPRQRTRLGILIATVSHDNEQYGIMTVHLRLKGIVPPASERPAGR